MTLEFGGKVMIECEKTGYKAEVEFKLKDQEVFIQENGSTASEPFWTPTVEIRNQRLQRCIVPQNEQFPFESERLWQHVTQAILDRDQNLATHEKSLLEEAQRQSARHRKETGTIWLPRLFHQDISGSWHYRYSDTRPWDALNDVLQFEKYGVIRAKMKHGPCIAPVLGLGGASVGSKNYHSDELDLLKHKGNIHRRKCSTPDPQHQDSSDNDELLAERLRTRRQRDLMEIRDLMTSIQRTQEDINRALHSLWILLLAKHPVMHNLDLPLSPLRLIQCLPHTSHELHVSRNNMLCWKTSAVLSSKLQESRDGCVLNYLNIYKDWLYGDLNLCSITLSPLLTYL
uniref:oxysterol-binding protein-related protein 8-like isoform X3 n=1 Tax=Myxine glutinosa TaxID=7769 RepID=UPI0035900129